MKGQKVSAYLNTKGIQHKMIELDISSIRDLADRAGINESNLSRAMSHHREPSREVMIRLSLALSMDFEELLDVQIHKEDEKQVAA